MVPTSSSEKHCSKELGPGVGLGVRGGPARCPSPGPSPHSSGHLSSQSSGLGGWRLVGWRGSVLWLGHCPPPAPLQLGVSSVWLVESRQAGEGGGHLPVADLVLLPHRFEIDDSSPSMSGCCGEDCSYEILSRRTKFGDSQHSHAGGHCGGCCH